MYSLSGCWSWPRPEDLERFEEGYADHCRKALAVPGLTELVLTRFERLPGDEADPPYYRSATLVFASAADLDRGMASPEAAAMAADMEAIMARFDVAVTGFGAGPQARLTPPTAPQMTGSTSRR